MNIYVNKYNLILYILYNIYIVLFRVVGALVSAAVVAAITAAVLLGELPSRNTSCSQPTVFYSLLGVLASAPLAAAAITAVGFLYKFQSEAQNFKTQRNASR